MRRHAPLSHACWTVSLVLIAAGARAAEPVTLRTSSGAFVRVAADGSLVADALTPQTECLLELTSEPGDQLVLKTRDGRWLLPHPKDPARLWAAKPAADPGAVGRLHLVAVDAQRLALRAAGQPGYVRFLGDDRPLPTFPLALPPSPSETIQIFRVSQSLQNLLPIFSATMGTLLSSELGAQEYNTVNVQKQEAFIDLPAPTWDNWGAKKRHQILGLEQRYRLTAQLHGTPEIGLTEMPVLRNFRRAESGTVLYTLTAQLPVRGRVEFEMPGLVYTPVAYRTLIALTITGEFPVERKDKQLTLGDPKVARLDVQLQKLDISNDVLQAVRVPIRDIINDEVRKSHDRIRREAERALRTAGQPLQFQSELVRCLEWL